MEAAEETEKQAPSRAPHEETLSSWERCSSVLSADTSVHVRNCPEQDRFVMGICSYSGHFLKWIAVSAESTVFRQKINSKRKELPLDHAAANKYWKGEQSILKDRLIISNTETWQNMPNFHGLERVGGVDLSYVKEDDTIACASLIVLSYPNLEVIYEDCQMVILDAPYVAGFLAFREVPSLVEAVKRLEAKDCTLMPQVLLVDGNGVLHHRGFGIACHLGILTGLPTIGVAKNLLQVDGIENNESHREQAKELLNGGEFFHLKGSSGNILGAALKSSQKSFKPIYISVGHKISLETAVKLVHSCCKYRVPEPTRQADIRSREFCVKITNEKQKPQDLHQDCKACEQQDEN